jgi:hypothetical protein
MLPCTRSHTQALGLIRDVVVLEFEGFAIARKVSAACEPDLGKGEVLQGKLWASQFMFICSC